MFGHQGIIHDLRWHKKNRYLMSSSSDSSVRIWYIPPRADVSQMTEKGSYELLVCTMIHPSFVYSADFHPTGAGKGRMIIATACFDSKVRIWLIALDPVTGRFIEQGINMLIFKN